MAWKLWNSPERWTQALINARLREHPIDLEHTKTIPDLSATVTAYDLNGDGTDEYILFVNADYIGYFVLQREGSGYRFVDTPLPYGVPCKNSISRLV